MLWSTSHTITFLSCGMKSLPEWMLHPCNKKLQQTIIYYLTYQSALTVLLLGSQCNPPHPPALPNAPHTKLSGCFRVSYLYSGTWTSNLYWLWSFAQEGVLLNNTFHCSSVQPSYMHANPSLFLTIHSERTVFTEGLSMGRMKSFCSWHSLICNSFPQFWVLHFKTPPVVLRPCNA